VAEKPPSDPLSVWRELVSQWEKSVNSVANESMGSDQFSSSMNKALGASAQAQHLMTEAMSRYLATLNLPSREDVINIGERLQSIEAHLTRVVELLEAFPKSRRRRLVRAAPSMPPRTKRPSKPGKAE
jgi:hypothetical protein